MGLFRRSQISPQPSNLPEVKTPVLPTGPIELPHGIVIQTEHGKFFVNGKFRHRITSDRVFDSWSFPFVAMTNEFAASNYKVMGKLGFRDGTLIESLLDRNIYLISANKKRRVLSPDTAEYLGLNLRNAILVTDEEVNLHKDGEVLK